MPDLSLQKAETRHQVATCAVAFLLGLGGAVHIGTAVASLWGFERNSVMPVLLLTLGWASVGAWIPDRLLAGLLRGLWKKVAGERALREDLTVLQPRRRSHRVLLWLMMASVASMIGLSELTVILLNGWGASFGAYLQSHFLWTAMTWFLARFLVLAAILFLPSVLMGMAAAGLGSLSSAHGNDQIRGPLPVLIMGGGAGMLALQLPAVGWQAESMGFLLASIPFFAASWMAGIAATWVEKETDESLDEIVHVPGEASRDRYLIAAGLAAWGALTALWVTGHSDGEGVHPAFLVGIGLGTAVGEWWLSDQRHSRGGAGMAVWVLGLASAVGIACWGRQSAFLNPLGKTVLMFTISSITGFVLPYLLRSLASRYTTFGRSHSLATSLLMGSATLVILVSYLLPDTPQTWIRLLAVFSLLAVALGGLLVIHDEDARPGPRRSRLVLIFGGLILLMGIFAWSNAAP